MIAYPLSGLEAWFSASEECLGFLDPETLALHYGNAAFERKLQMVRLAGGQHPLLDWPPVRAAIARCAAQSLVRTQLHTQLHVFEATQWNTRLELLPVHLLHDDGRAQVAVLCKLMSIDVHQGTQFDQEVLENLPCSTLACTVNGEIFWTNRSSKRFAYGDSDIAQLDQHQHLAKLHPDDVQHATLVFHTGMADGKIPYLRVRMRNHAGHYEWFEMQGEPVRAKDGSIRFWLCSSINIQRYVEAEQQLQAQVQLLQAQLEEAQSLVSAKQKIELVSHLAAGVAHDLNNLLFVMRMHMASLQKKYPDSDSTTSLQAVQDCIRKAARLSSQLSGFSGRLPQNAAPLHTGRLIEDIRGLLTQAVGAEVDLQVWVDPQVPAVHADRSFLESALINLLINARDAVDGRGAVVLRVEAVAGEAPGMVAFHVTDNGVGMSDEVQAKVFDPFFTTKAPDRGTGLGLSMVKNFADSSGGRIAVCSQLGQGTTMSLYLPVSSQQAAAPLQAPGQPSAIPLGEGAVVLLVEDDEAVRQAVSLVLREHGYRTIAAHNIEHALDLLEVGIRPDVILSDIRMPGQKTVHDLIAQVQALGRQTPMLFITGYSADVVIQEGLLQQRYPVLFKPVSARELLHKLADLQAAPA